jgi:hypothetical protein
VTSPFPTTTVISETKIRTPRMSITDKRSIGAVPLATNQYIKAWDEGYQHTHHRQLQLNFSVNKLSVSLMDELSNICLFPEILRLTVDRLTLLFHQDVLDLEPSLIQKQIFCSLQQLQIDNQCYSPTKNFDFPVLLMPRKNERSVKVKPSPQPKVEKKEFVSNRIRNIVQIDFSFSVNASFNNQHHRQNSSSSSIDTSVLEDSICSFDSLSHNHRMARPIQSTMIGPNFLTLHLHRVNERFIRIDLQCQPFDVYLEDRFVYVLLKIASEFLPLDLTLPGQRYSRVSTIDPIVMKTPFVCESLCISPINIVVSVHASLKVFIGCHQLPIYVDKFQKSHIYSTNKQLMGLLTRHYLVSLLTRSPWLIGSFDLLGKQSSLLVIRRMRIILLTGNPSALIRNVTDGIYDLFHLPYVGMREGPSGFMFGISQGAASLLKHFSLGESN